MADIRLISNGNREIKPLVESALSNEFRLLQAGIQQTEKRLKEFENKYQLNTREFVTRYENNEFEETLDFAEWIGEFRTLIRLNDKAETIKDIRFAD